MSLPEDSLRPEEIQALKDYLAERWPVLAQILKAPPGSGIGQGKYAYHSAIGIWLGLKIGYALGRADK